MPDWYDEFASGPKHRPVVPLDIDDDDEPPPTPDPVPVRPGVLAAFDPGRRGIRALAIVAAVVVCVAAFFAWRARPHATPVPNAVAATSAVPMVAGSSTP